MQFDLRHMRRQYGISQTALADLIGVDQATVSRWERGLENVNPKRRLELVDLFLNKRDRLGPIVEKYIRHHRYVAVSDKNNTMLHMSPALAKANMSNLSDVIGSHYQDRVEISWFNQILEDLQDPDPLMINVVHDFDKKCGQGVIPLNGRHLRGVWLELEGHERTFVGIVNLVERTNEPPQLLDAMTINRLTDNQ